MKSLAPPLVSPMKNKALQALEDLGIEYELFEHEPWFTCEDGEELEKQWVGAKTKNLFLRNRKGKRHFLVIIQTHERADLHQIQTMVGEPQKLSFASDERLMKYLGVTPGSVTALGLIKDEAAEVEVIVNNSVLEHEHIYCHPCDNAATVKMTQEDFLRFLESRPNQVSFADL